jgi:predicted nucleotide-binding protein
MSKDIKNIIDKQIQLLTNINAGLDIRLPKWKDKAIKSLSEHINTEDLELMQSINGQSWQDDKDAYLEILKEFKINLSDNPEDVLTEEPLPEKRRKTKNIQSNKIFVVHGHDALARTETSRLLEKIGLEPIVLHEQPNEGKTVIEKFERDASQVSFAIAILTPDDIGHPVNKANEAKPRARQNVILELGYFSGILGRKNVVVLYKGNVEIPSDYLGVVYIAIDSAGAWKFNLAKELKQAGLSVDLNKLI